VGKDLRQLASACSQLVADTGGKVDVEAVRRYHSGVVGVSGFTVAERAVTGDTAGAIEALEWALHTGVPEVVLADALADAVHSVMIVGTQRGAPSADLARQGLRRGRSRRSPRRPGTGASTPWAVRYRWWPVSTARSRDRRRTRSTRSSGRSGRWAPSPEDRSHPGGYAGDHRGPGDVRGLPGRREPTAHPGCAVGSRSRVAAVAAAGLGRTREGPVPGGVRAC